MSNVLNFTRPSRVSEQPSPSRDPTPDRQPFSQVEVLHMNATLEIAGAITLLEATHLRIRKMAAEIANPSIKAKLQGDLRLIEQMLELAKSKASAI
ncbi:hypothetical protein SAMN05216338_10749 [Bradyrhizobium sp. Rc2d]|uniref:hypothetical protein n=1 Tax=Bradyrhizobium sp. Rc2d TaxID=1855321 RepID=UPI000883370F|nr:hypothetical protein [Bradyrhizobium sp. Rc2d]SDJ93227.1 hypothetical protein SAMN05216338_10749 [Bradyrhizobium sp. Rc2d]